MWLVLASGLCHPWARTVKSGLFLPLVQWLCHLYWVGSLINWRDPQSLSQQVGKSPQKPALGPYCVELLSSGLHLTLMCYVSTVLPACGWEGLTLNSRSDWPVEPSISFEHEPILSALWARNKGKIPQRIENRDENGYLYARIHSSIQLTRPSINKVW